MLMPILYPYIKFSLGTLYPAYKTWKALKRKDETIRRRWMKYWVSFSAFQLFELLGDVTLFFVMPFYIEFKIASITWLVLGTKLVFDTIVNRELTKREKTIDRWLNKVSKARDEFVALVWFELSRCSVKIVTGIMSGGLSVVLSKSPHQCDPDQIEEQEKDEPHLMQIDGQDDNNGSEIYQEKPRKRKIVSNGNCKMDSDFDKIQCQASNNNNEDC